MDRETPVNQVRLEQHEGGTVNAGAVTWAWQVFGVPLPFSQVASTAVYLYSMYTVNVFDKSTKRNEADLTSCSLVTIR